MTQAKAKKRKARRREGQRHAAQEPRDVSLGRWDQGADGPANRRGLVVEPRGDVDADTGKLRNPNGVKGVRRVDMIEFWAKRGTISTRARTAAETLRDAYEATMRAPGWPDSERVDKTARPDHAVTIQIDRMSKYHAINRLVPADDRAIIDACVLHGHTPGAVGYLREDYQRGLRVLSDALERLADRIERRRS